MQGRLIIDMLPYLLPGIEKDYPDQPVGFHVSTRAAPKVSFVASSGMQTEAEFDLVVYVLPSEAPTHTTASPSGLGTLVAGRYADLPRRRRPLQEDIASEQLRGAGHGAMTSSQHSAGALVMDAMHRHYGQRGAPFPGAIEVARLRGKASGCVCVDFEQATVTDMRAQSYDVEFSKYHVDEPMLKEWAKATELLVPLMAKSWGLKALYEHFVPSDVTLMFVPQNVTAQYLQGWYAVSTDLEVR